MKIAVFYHCLFFLAEPWNFRMRALEIVHEQMQALKFCGLLDAASEMIVGINGGDETEDFAKIFIPPKARMVFHGLQCRNECRTIVELEKWLPGHPGWYVCYFHAKGCTENPVLSPDQRNRWRACMQRNVISNWRQCVKDLDSGYEAVGCHWMTPPATPPGQYIFAGTFWWAKSDFLLTLPSIMARDRIKVSGLDSIESRYEAEVWLGNGPRPPRIKDYHPNWNPSKVSSCQL